MRRLPFYILSAMLPVIAISATQRTGKSTTAEFQARYNGLNKAFLQKDVLAAGKYIADDYSGGVYQHPMDKKSTLEGLKHWDGRFRTTSRTVLGVVVNGDKATATTDLFTVGKITDKAGTHKIEIKARCVDTWQKYKAGWQLKHSRMVHSGTTYDGHPSGMGKPNQK